jgi:sortase A
LEATKRYPVLISSLVDEETGDFKFTDNDSSKLSNWFDEDKSSDFVTQRVKYFTISIPKLRIESATVALGSEDLKSNLIQYPGTAYPGKTGNTVVFGHSILPQYFNPKNYMSIFSTLNTLKKGDEIYADYDGITYKYRVENMFEVKPTDIQILEQSFGSSYISLVTCSPMGHPLKPRRLIVRAKLVPAQLDMERISANKDEILRN